MSEPKTGKKPADAGGGGIETPGQGEVEGHARKLIYTCFNCGATNYVDPTWKYFTCWRCGPDNVNYIN